MACLREFEKVIDYIIGEIREGRAVVGSEIPSERQISAELCISRNSVREGVRALENMGVVESRHGSEITFLAAFPAASSVLST